MNTITMKELILGNYYLFDILLSIFNDCISQGIFPDCLKIGKIVPLHKKGEVVDIDNYRPVCILPVLSKFLEKAIKARMLTHFESNHLLSECQFGFRKERSTEMAIRKTVYFILEAMDESQKVSSIFCDLSKAFDCLRHDILIRKLCFYGFEGIELNILQSYLNNRVQIVNVNNTKSDTEYSNIGVPQGSILGPLLFLIYVNDLCNCLPDWALITLFADDTHVGIKNKDLKVIEERKNLVLSKLKEWFETNGIILNANKSSVLNYTYKRNNKNDTIEEVKFLGCTLDSTLCYDSHIENICKRLASANYVLFKLRPIIDRKTLVSVYYAYCHSIINYAITVWGNATQIEKVLICQKRSIRIIYGLNRLTSARAYFKKSKILTVISLFVFNSLIEVHSQKYSLPMKMNKHKYNTRNKEKLHVPGTRTVKTYKQGFCLKLDMYNKLPLQITKLSMNEFKPKLKMFFECHPFYHISEFMSCSFAYL